MAGRLAAALQLQERSARVPEPGQGCRPCRHGGGDEKTVEEPALNHTPPCGDLSMKFFCAAFTCCLLFVPSPLVSAAPIVVEAGQTYTLTEDLVLNGADTLEIKGTADKPC